LKKQVNLGKLNKKVLKLRKVAMLVLQ